jgi:predicted amidohydrolase YtcJ
LEAGKLAVVVLLDKNLLKMSIDAIKVIMALGTINAGNITFKKKTANERQYS